ncbi:NUDIX hydrolase [Candidatus Daviesbacteria bacterium]|nr:NUDIX hydrolase [Candidatus Daviesbacteria bacterium]
MQREFSAGGIVFNSKGQVLITQNSSNKYWGFPKGKIESGQTSKETALREVKEEGGVEALILEKIGDSKYVYTKDGEKIFKLVVMFLMKYLSGDPSLHDYEVSEANWYSYDEAMEKLSFKNDKELLIKASEKIKDYVGA